MSNRSLRPALEGGVLVAIAVILTMASLYLPIVGLFAAFVVPTPFIILGLRHGMKWSILAVLAATLYLSIFMGGQSGIYFLLNDGLLGIAIGAAVKLRWSVIKTLCAGVAVKILAMLAIIVLGSALMGIDVIHNFKTVFEQVPEQVVIIYRNIGIPEDKIAEMRQMTQASLELMQKVLPAIMVLAITVIVYVTITLTRAIARRFGIDIEGFPAIKYWNVQRWTLHAYLWAVALSYFGQTREIEWMQIIGYNLNAFVSMFLMLQGVAVFYFLTDKFSLSKGIRSIILVIVILNPFLMQLLVFVGIFDLIFDYRRLKRGDR